MITRSVAQLLEEHVTLDVEGIDRLYLNAYQPRLQTGAGVAAFFKGHRGARVASTTLMAPMSRAFVGEIQRFARREEVEVVRFTKGQRKDEVTQERLRGFNAPEGLLYLGIAQERFSTFRVEKRFSPPERQSLSLVGPLDGDVQPVLLLPPRPRLRAVLHQVLGVFTLHRSDLPQRP